MSMPCDYETFGYAADLCFFKPYAIAVYCGINNISIHLKFNLNKIDFCGCEKIKPLQKHFFCLFSYYFIVFSC